MAIDVAQGHLYGTVFEAGLYGIYLVLFFLAVFIFNVWRDKGRAPLIIISAIVFMFCLSTAHLAGTIQSLEDGFFKSRPAPPELYFNSKALPLNLVNKSLYGTNMIVGDMVMLYRLYIVSDGSIWYVAVPFLTLLGTGVIGYTTIWEFSQLKPGQSAFAEAIKNLAPALFILPLATNVIITALIIFKILQAQYRAREVANLETTSASRKVVANMIESGVLYPSLLLITVVLYEKNSNGQDIITGPMTQIVSIVPTLMWLQVRLGFSQYDAATRRPRSTGAVVSSIPGPLVFRLATSTQRDTEGIDIIDPNAKEDDAANPNMKESMAVSRSRVSSLSQFPPPPPSNSSTVAV